MKNSSEILQLPRFEREYLLDEYVKHVLNSAVQHCFIQCENHNALSKRSENLLLEIDHMIESYL